VSEIQSCKGLPLFILCPNGITDSGSNRDKNIPNPSFSSLSSLEYFKFVGKLMGLALLTMNPLPFNLSNFVWKPLVGMKLDRRDLEEVDLHCCRSLDTLLDIEKEGITELTFSDCISFTFTTNSFDGREVELLPGGKNRNVTWENRKEYIQLVEEYKLSECDEQVAALIEGISHLIPLSCLILFTPQELQDRICGNADVDMAILKKNTEYSGLKETDKLVKDFWSVVENFTIAERRLFLRFVCGRTTLPATLAESDHCFEIQKYYSLNDANPDNYLPQAYTCGFTLHLPDYSSKQVMREKLLYAINHCQDIDLDHDPHNDDHDVGEEHEVDLI